MSFIPLKIQDLVPKETTFQLSTAPGVTFTLCRWSLRVRAWALTKYTSEELKEIFENKNILHIADLAFFMLKEKELFNNDKDLFLDAVTTISDQVSLMGALLGAVGIGEPEVKKLSDALNGKEEFNLPKPETPAEPQTPAPTGPKSSTP